MSLAIVMKGPEGIVLAADSRVTLGAQNATTKESFSVTYDNATKMLTVKTQKHIGMVTYGIGAFGTPPRTVAVVETR